MDEPQHVVLVDTNSDNINSMINCNEVPRTIITISMLYLLVFMLNSARASGEVATNNRAAAHQIATLNTEHIVTALNLITRSRLCGFSD